MYYQCRMIITVKGNSEAEVCDSLEDALDQANVSASMQGFNITEHEGDYTPRPKIDRLSLLRQSKRKVTE